MEQKFDFKFTQAEVNVILAALAERPFKDVQALINQIITGFNAQVTPTPADSLVTDVKVK